MVFQWVFAGIFFAALVLTWRRVHQGVFRPMEGGLWSLLWVGALVVLWRPEASDVAAHVFGIGRGADFVLYIAVIGLLFSVFLLALAHDRTERQLTRLVQHQALEEFRRHRERV